MTTKDNHEYFMNLALKEALLAYASGEVPIGAIIVKDGKVLSKAHNMKESSQDPTSHAEVLAIKKAAKKLINWRLKGLTMYVTAEPCLMCLGAIIHSRIDHLVFSTKEFKMGAVISLYQGILDNPNLHHKTSFSFGVKEKTSSWLLSRFFNKIRQKYIVE